MACFILIGFLVFALYIYQQSNIIILGIVIVLILLIYTIKIVKHACPS